MMITVILLSVELYEKAATLFLASVIVIGVFYQLITGELSRTEFGSWVGSRENDPVKFWLFVSGEAAVALFLLAHLAIHQLQSGWVRGLLALSRNLHLQPVAPARWSRGVAFGVHSGAPHFYQRR